MLNFSFAEYGFRYGKQNGQNGNGQGEKGGDFSAQRFEKYNPTLDDYQTGHERKTPLLRWQRAVFWFHLFP